MCKQRVPLRAEKASPGGEASMRRWCKTRGLFAVGLVSLAVLASTAHGQFPPPGNYGPPPGDMGGPPADSGPPGPPGHGGKESSSPLSLKDDGAPNAFTDMFSPRAASRPRLLP